MSKTHYLTAEGLEKLKEELNQLMSIEREAAARAIAEARDKGDLSENAEYDAAKDAQGLLEHVHRHVAGVGLEECPQCRTTDDQHLEGLNQGGDLAVGQHVSAEHTREYDDDADNFSHR